MNEIQCIDVIDGFKNLQDESFDIILIDPPYFQAIKADWDNQWKSLDEYVNWCNSWLKESVRCLKNSGSIFIYGFPEILAHLSVLLPVEQVRWISWHYKNKAVPRNTYFTRSWEGIIHFWKDKEKRIFNLDAVRQKYSPVFLANSAGKTRKNTAGRFGNETTTYNANPLGCLPRDTLEISHDDIIDVSALAGGAGKVQRFFLCKTCQDVFWNSELKNHKDHLVVKHPTQKPALLTHTLLTSVTPKSDGNLLIPFVGSGAEIAVAEQISGIKNIIGFEIDQDYVMLATKFLSMIKILK